MKQVLACVFLLQALVLVQSQLDDYRDGSRVIIGGINYYFGQFEDVTWNNASQQCQDLSMKLASFETQSEHDSVMNYILQNSGVDFWMWTSGKRNSGSSTWTWSATSTPITSDGWMADQPSMADSEEACLNFSATAGGWDDDACSRTMSFLCEE